MRRRQMLTLSRLKMAWFVLIATVLLGIGLVWVAPDLNDGIAPVAITLPEEPDRFAVASPDGASVRPIGVPSAGAEEASASAQTEQAPSAPPADDEGPVETVEDALVAEGAGAVVITLPTDTRADDDEVIIAAIPPEALDPALVATTADGNRPKIGLDGRRPFDVYRRHQAAQEGRASLAIMVSGLGLDLALTNRAIDELPAEVTLSFAPYARNLEQVMARAMADGHEVVIEVPMETAGVSDEALGPAALMSSREADANARRLGWILSRAPAYAMVTNYLGQRYSADDGAMAFVMASVGSAGLGYIDDTGLAQGAAASAGVPYASIDAVVPPGAVDVTAQLNTLAGRAGPNDAVAVKVYAAGGGLEAVLLWLNRRDGDDVDILPISSVVGEN